MYYVLHCTSQCLNLVTSMGTGKSIYRDLMQNQVTTTDTPSVTISYKKADRKEKKRQSMIDFAVKAVHISKLLDTRTHVATPSFFSHTSFQFSKHLTCTLDPQPSPHQVSGKTGALKKRLALNALNALLTNGAIHSLEAPSCMYSHGTCIRRLDPNPSGTSNT